MFDFAKLCRNYGVDTAPRGDKHARPGWINVFCPFCRNPKRYHLGFNLSKGYFYCWKCGKKNFTATVKEITGTSTAEAVQLIKIYQCSRPTQSSEQNETDDTATYCELPKCYEFWESVHRIGTNTAACRTRAINYIARRGFYPRDIIQEWNLKYTDHLAYYPYRIVIPYYHDGQLVTYQLRDYTGKQPVPYLTNHKRNAVLDVKDTLYGIDKAVQYDTCIVTEGVVDTWAVGTPAVATSGTTWKLPQAMLLAARWRKVYVLFDQGEEEATEFANSLAQCICDLDGDAEVLDLPECHSKDPGDFSAGTIRELRNELLSQEGA